MSIPLTSERLGNGTYDGSLAFYRAWLVQSLNNQKSKTTVT